MYKKIIIGLIACLLIISPIAGAQNWDSFQGNNQHDAYRDDASDFVTNLWTFNLQSPVYSSPAIYKDYIYLASSEGLLYSIDMEKGDEQWSFDLESNTNSSPIVHKNILYIGTEDGLKAININNHEINWEYDTSDAVVSTPFYYKDVVYFGCDDGHLYGLNSTNGKVVLNKKLDGELKTSPIVHDNDIFIGSTNGKLYSVGTDKNKNWEFTTGDEILSSPAYVNNTVMFGSSDGSLYCLNSSSGELIFKQDLNNKVISSPTIDEYDNNVYVGSDEGNLTCLDIRDGTIKWSFSTGSPVKSTPVLKENLISFGSNNGKFYVLNKYTGQEEFSYNPGTVLFNSPITSSGVINGNSLFFADESGYLYSLNIDKYEVPASVYLYYSLAVLILVIIVAIVVVKKVKGRK